MIICLVDDAYLISLLSVLRLGHSPIIPVCVTEIVLVALLLLDYTCVLNAVYWVQLE